MSENEKLIQKYIEIQKFQLSRWKQILKKKVYKKVKRYILSTNVGVEKPTAIVRGNKMDVYVHNLANSKLRTKLEKKVKPTKTQRELINKALGILVGDDLTDSKVLALIGKIKDNENQSDLIDYVDGVQVWEKLELEFTCEEFLKEIGYK